MICTRAWGDPAHMMQAWVALYAVGSPVVFGANGPEMEEPASVLSKEQRQILLRLLKNWKRAGKMIADEIGV